MEHCDEANTHARTTNGESTRTGASSIIKQHNNIKYSGHPVLAHKVTILRSSLTPPAGFRAVLREITFHLGHEATSTLHTRSIDISIPVCSAGSTTTPSASESVNASSDGLVVSKGSKVVEKVALVPIMRSGLGMVESMLEVLPNAAVHHIGIYKQGSMPVMYYSRLPKACSVQVAYVLDPTIGSAHTIMSVVGLLKKWGVPKIHIITVVASREGLETVAGSHPDVTITVGAIDEDPLDGNGHLVPGLGDSGDRLYGTVTDDGDDEALLHVSKRKRSITDYASDTA